MAFLSDISPRRRFIVITSLALTLVIGFGAGWLFRSRSADSSASAAYPIREVNPAYHFIRPLIAFNVGDKTQFKEYAPLVSAMDGYLNQAKQNHKLDSASIYFQDFMNGHWTGVNEDTKFALASLYKVALMIAYLKDAETDPRVLDTRILFTGSREEGALDYEPMTPGQSYSVRELLYRLIVNSDNDAKDLLHDHISLAAVEEVFKTFRLTPPAATEVGDSMSPKEYARLFRTLFSSTYLSRESSEATLDLLSQVEFKEGIVAGLPKNITVAHKYGYRTFPKGNDVTQELHECGVIYYPDDPYLLCVMTKGWNVTDLKEFIKDTSAIVYDAVQKEHAK